MAYTLTPFVYNLLQKFVHGDYAVDRELIRKFRGNSGGKTLEVGCGTGLCSTFFAPGNYVGVDVAEERIEQAKSVYPQYEFRVQDLTKESTDDLEDFESILFHNVIHHIDEAGIKQIIGTFQAIARKRGKPVPALLIEPVLPPRPWLNPVGYFLAKIDRGKYVRTLPDLEKVLGVKVTSISHLEHIWYWPVEGVAMTLAIS